MGTISLLSHSFMDGYNRNISRVFGGGLERYIADLCEVIRELGEQPEIHQLSYFESFHTIWNGINVYGHPYDFDRIPEAFSLMAKQAKGRLVYASCIWHPIAYRPGSLGICHGINWDSHLLPRDVKLGVANCVQSALDQLSAIVSVDSHFQTYCRSVCRFDDPGQITVIPNNVDTLHFTPLAASAAGKGESNTDGRKLRILYPRRLSQERGIIPMMRLTDALLGRYGDRVDVEFAGELVENSPIGDAFEVWRSAHPQSQSILHRRYNFDNIRDAYHRADIVVIPTVFSEGTSYSCLEAMSCGLPIVATNVGGLNDLIIDGSNGLLVSPKTESMLPAIERLIHHAPLRRQLGKQARKTAQAFDKQQWKRRWRAVLENYMNREPSPE